MKRVNGKGNDKTRGRLSPASCFIGRVEARRLRGDEAVKAVHALVAGGRGKAYLVGGMVRDVLIGCAPSNARDYDFAVELADNGDVAAFANRLAMRLNGSPFALDKNEPSYRVVFMSNGARSNADISGVKGNGIIQDLTLRDFTVNAAAIDLQALFACPRGLKAGEGDGAKVFLIDPLKGKEDAAAKLLRMTGQRVFDDDPLRSLRAIRLAVRYGLAITQDTLEAMRLVAGSLEKVSAERLRDEMLLMFAGPGAAQCMRMLLDLGLAIFVFPALTAWKQLKEYDLTAHSLSALDEAELLLGSPDALSAIFGRHAPEVIRHLDAEIGVVSRRALLKLSAFFHDVGKALIMTRVGGVLHFIGHESQGALIARPMLRRLKMSRAMVLSLVNMIKNHHRVFAFAALNKPSERAKAHLIRVCGNESVEALCLAVADARATRRGEEDNELLSVVKSLADFYFDVYSRKKPKPVMDGSFVMKTFGLKQGVIIGEILRRVNEEVEAGAIRNKKEAVRFVRKLLPFFQREA
ncbi:MAG: HD domain-containing protein [Deltaproteobacteria bacterium]|nr:HD domain-containing protein [Deltaproteobacteria bacterium]